MKQALTRELYAYWNALRGARSAPSRDDVSPGAIRSHLAHTFLLALDDGDGHAFRLAGSAVCELFGRELKGAPFTALWSETGRARVDALLTDIIGDTSGAVAHVIGRNDENDVIDLEMILLPLLDIAGNATQVLGGFAPVSAPYWVGSRTVTSIELEALRYVGPGVEIPAPRTMISNAAHRLPGQGFALYAAKPSHHVRRG